MKKSAEAALNKDRTRREGSVADDNDDVYVGMNRLTGKNPSACTTVIPTCKNSHVSINIYLLRYEGNLLRQRALDSSTMINLAVAKVSEGHQCWAHE